MRRAGAGRSFVDQRFGDQRAGNQGYALLKDEEDIVDDDLLLKDEQDVLNTFQAARAAAYQQLQKEAEEFTAKYDTAEDKDQEYVKFLGIKLYRNTPKDKQRFFGNLFVSRIFSVGCGLTVMGSFMTAMAALFPAAPMALAIGIALPFLFFTTKVNWGITKKKIPQILHDSFLGKAFQALFRYKTNEYQNLLDEYFAELDDKITQKRARLQVVVELMKVRLLSANETQELAALRKELVSLLRQRNTTKLPERNLPWYKKAIIGISLPLVTVGGLIFGVLAYTLTLKSLFAALLLIPSMAALATPPGWLIGLCIVFGAMTAPAMTAIFTYGVSNLVKARHGVKKALNFLADFFKEEVNVPANGPIKTFTAKNVASALAKVIVLAGAIALMASPLGIIGQIIGGLVAFGTVIFSLASFKKKPDPTAGIRKVVTPSSLLNGLVKSVFMAGLLGLVTFGQVFSMAGGGAIFLDIFKELSFVSTAATVIANYVLPAMACAALLPFYWLQTLVTGKSWTKGGLDYFRNPITVIDKKIQQVEELKKGGELGPKTAENLIEKLKHEQAQYAHEDLELCKTTWNIFGRQYNIGKYLVKVPFWLRDLASFQLPRTMNAIGNGFISLYGALTAGGQTTPNIEDPAITSPSNPDLSYGLTTQDIIADVGGVAGSYCAASKDPMDEPSKDYLAAAKAGFANERLTGVKEMYSTYCRKFDWLADAGRRSRAASGGVPPAYPPVVGNTAPALGVA